MAALNFTDSEKAWVVEEYLAGRKQTEIGPALGIVSGTVSAIIRSFCDDWSGADVADLQVYDYERKKYALKALQNYLMSTGMHPRRPTTNLSKCYFKARHEYGWLLRAEGMTYQQIADRFGISASRAREDVLMFGRFMRKAMKRTKFRFENNEIT